MQSGPKEARIWGVENARAALKGARVWGYKTVRVVRYIHTVNGVRVWDYTARVGVISWALL